MISFEAGSPADANDHDRGDHVFEAMHTPPPVREVTAAEFREGQGGSESGQAHALAALDETKPFLFIAGIPGTGKSHLIRWLHLNREISAANAREVRAYVPRSMTRLRDVLRRVLEFADPAVRERLERDVDTATTGLDERSARGQLLANLAQVIEGRAAAIRSGQDSSFQRRAHVEIVDDLHELLRAKPVREFLCRDGGSLDRMVTTRVTGQRTGDMSADEELRIHEDDLRSLARIRTDGLAREAERLLSKIANDPGVRQAAHELLGPVHSDPALQRLVGLSVGQMQEAMTDLLASLHEEGRRLVLFFEDWGLISGLQEEMAEAIAAAPQGSVLAVVAITSDRLQEQRNNVLERGRIFILDPPSTAVPGAELARSHPGAAVLAARALNAVRWGRDQLEKHYAEREPGQDWLSSKCEVDCPFDVREACHETFGHIRVEGVGDVGYFPFSETALRNALTRKAGGGAAVPRIVLHEVLRSGLGTRYADELENSAFPSPAFAEEFRPNDLRLTQAQETTLKVTLDEQGRASELPRVKAFLETYRSGRALDTFDDQPRAALELPKVAEKPQSRPGSQGTSGESEVRVPQGPEPEIPPLAKEALSWGQGGTVTADRQLRELAVREVLAALPVFRPIWRRKEWIRAGLDQTHVSLGRRGKYAAGGPELRIESSQAEALAWLAWSFERGGSWQELESVPVARTQTDAALDRWVRDVSVQLFDDHALRERIVESLMRVLAITGLATGHARDLTDENILDVIFCDSAGSTGDEFSRIGSGGGARSQTLDILHRYVSFSQGSGAPIAIDHDFVAPIAERIVQDSSLPEVNDLPPDAPEWAREARQQLAAAVEEHRYRVQKWWDSYGDVFIDRDQVAELTVALKAFAHRSLSAVDPATNVAVLPAQQKDLVRKLDSAVDRVNESLDAAEEDVLEALLASRAFLAAEDLPLSARIVGARELQELVPFRNQLTTLYIATLELLGVVEDRLPDEGAGGALDTSDLDAALEMGRAAAEQLGGGT